MRRHLVPKLDLSEFVRRVVRKWLLILIPALIGCVAAYLVVTEFPSQYEASSKYIYDLKEKKIISEETPLSPLAERYYAAAAEVEIMRSDEVLRRLVLDLGLHKNEAFFEGNVMEVFLDRVLELAERSLQANPITHSLSVGDVGVVPLQVALVTPLTSDEELVGAAVGVLRNRLEIEMDRQTTIVTVKYKSTDPVLSASICNGLIAAYKKYQGARQFEAAERASSWLRQRLAELGPKISKRDREMVAVGAEHKLGVGAGTEGSTVLEDIAELEKQVQQLANDEAAKKRAFDLATEAFKRGALDAAGLASQASGLVRSIETQLGEARKRRAELLARVGRGHPWVVRVDREIGSLKEQLRQEFKRQVSLLGSELAEVQARRASIEERLGQLAARADKAREASVELRTLGQEASATRKVFTSLLDRYQETLQLSRLQSDDLHVITAAVPPQEASRLLPLAIGFGFIFGGLGVGLGGAAGLALLSQRPRSSQEFANAVGFVADAFLPFCRSVAWAPETKVGSREFQAGIDRIRARFETHLLPTPVKAVLFAGTTAKAGTTTIAKAVAASTARAGTNTLLVNISRTKLSGRGSEDTGDTPCHLRDLLKSPATVKSHVKFDEASSVHHLVFYLEPNETIQHVTTAARLVDLFAVLREQFDLVIIDAPPTDQGTDAEILAEFSDAVFVVARWNRASYGELRTATRRVNVRAGMAIGTVVNRAAGSYVARFNRS